jgi:hypothetical protein
MNYVMLPAYISSQLNNSIMSWLAQMPSGSWQFNNKVGEPAKLEFIDGEWATVFKLKFGNCNG